MEITIQEALNNRSFQEQLENSDTAALNVLEHMINTSKNKSLFYVVEHMLRGDELNNKLALEILTELNTINSVGGPLSGTPGFVYNEELVSFYSEIISNDETLYNISKENMQALQNEFNRQNGRVLDPDSDEFAKMASWLVLETVVNDTLSADSTEIQNIVNNIVEQEKKTPLSFKDNEPSVKNIDR